MMFHSAIQNADAQANALWGELDEVCRGLAEIGAERRRLTEILPWWAAPGRHSIDSDGNLHGNVVWWPVSQEFRLPHAGTFRRIRVHENMIDEICSVGFGSDSQRAELREKLMGAYEQRKSEQQKLQRDVGLPSVNNRLRQLEIRFHRIRDELLRLASSGSHAALAGAQLFKFANESRYEDESLGPLALGVLAIAAPYCNGLLKEHVDMMLRHPKKQRRTCRFAQRHPDTEWGFVVIDCEKLPDSVLYEREAAI